MSSQLDHGQGDIRDDHFEPSMFYLEYGHNETVVLSRRRDTFRYLVDSLKFYFVNISSRCDTIW